MTTTRAGPCGVQPFRPRIAVAHPHLLGGGSEMTAMWALHALQRDFQLTLLTGAPVDWDRLNSACGTEVDPKSINVLQAPMPSGLRRIGAGDALRAAFFQRMCRRVGPQFDLCVSAYNFIDFGVAAVQLIADFSWDDELRRKFDRTVQPGVRGLMQRPSPLRAGYLCATRLIAGGLGRGHPGDVVIANSRWSADVLERRHGVQASVVYPPVPVWPSVTVEHPRGRDFVLLGRISPEKRVEDAIEVLRGVRARGHNVRLHIIGPLDGSPYSRRVERAARDAGPWVELHGGLYGADKMRMLASHGFGIQLCEREAFGIAVAEMVQAGVVPFVPADSAPVEIVADKRLTFAGVSDAIECIDHMLRDADALASIRSRLNEQAKLFSAKQYVASLRQLVAEQLVKAVAAPASMA